MTEPNKAVEAIRAFLPTNLSLDNPNIGDDVRMPLDCTMGELRALAAALSRPTQTADAVEAAAERAYCASCALTDEGTIGWDILGNDDKQPWRDIATAALSHTAISEVEPMRVLLPPGNADDRYLEGWCEGQAYLIENYGKEGEGDAAIESVNQYLATLTHDSALQSNSDSELLRETLDEILSRRKNVISTYERLGPDWTTESCEYEGAAGVQAAAEEDVDYIEQALAHLEQGAA